LRALEDGPRSAALAQLRAVLIQERVGRKRDSLVEGHSSLVGDSVWLWPL